MGRIQSSVGLISGMDIAGTVDKLVELESVPLKNLQARVKTYQEQQAAFADLTTLFSRASYMISNLAKSTVYDRLGVKSSNESVLKATRNGNPTAGTHTFTPVKMATSHQILSSGVSSATNSLNKKADITVRFGRNLETNVNLKDLNGGDGFQRGQFRITDQSGAKATIDLRSATTMQDVLSAINDNDTVNVLAELDGDRLKLTDLSGGNSNNLTIQELGSGSTAASLGIAGINTNQKTATGANIVRLGNNLAIDALNDGNGIPFDKIFTDLSVTLSDGTKFEIDFDALKAVTEGGASDTKQRETQATLGELMQVINSAKPGKLKVEIADDGTSLIWKDLTHASNPTGSLIVKAASSNNNPILHALGIGDFNEAGGVGGYQVASDTGEIAGQRIIGNLNSVLLTSLNGGRGITLTAGDVKIKDRDGNTGTITFTENEVKGIDTLDQYVSLMNEKIAATDAKIKVRMNAAKSGLELVDSSNGSSTTMQFQDDNGGNLALAMGLERKEDTPISSYISKNLNLQVISMNTKLSDLNGGKGVDTAGGIIVTDSKGNSATISIIPEMVTVNDLAVAIANSNASVILKVNESGDGLMLVDTAKGTGKLSVGENGPYSTTAKDLHFLSSGVESKDAFGTGTNYQTIDGSMTFRISFEETASLNSVRDAINQMNVGFSASVINDGSSYRLSVGSNQTGYTSNIVLDLSQFGLTQEDLSHAQDAVLIYGENNGSGVMITSRKNSGIEPVAGISLTINSASTSPITVSTEQSSTEIKTSLKTFVENYNLFREKLSEYTYANPYSGTYGALASDSLALRLESQINGFLTGQFLGLGTINNLQQLGITYAEKSGEYGEIQTADDETQLESNKKIGLLAFDEEVFDQMFKENPAAIKDFFAKTVDVFDKKTGETTKQEIGFASKYKAMADSFTMVNTGSIGVRYSSLQKKIDDGTDRQTFLQSLLDSKRTRLTNSFVKMEQALAKMQDASQAVSQIGASSSSS